MDTDVQGIPASTPPGSPRLPRVERREKAVADALRSLIRDTHLERSGTAEPRQADLSLHISLRVRPAENWTIDFEPRLSEQIGHQLDEACTARGVYSPGRVYCFRCDDAWCGHTVPPSALSVFRGYGETGLPEWQDLHQALVEARDERVARLFEGRPEVVALVQLGHGLRERQLSSFGRSSKTYALLGQVVAGYFRPPPAAAEPGFPDRLAMTFQVVETRDAAGRTCVRLNVLTRLRDGSDLDELFASDWEPWVHRARELAAHAVETIERRVQAARASGRSEEVQAAMRRVPAVLKRLAEFLERGHRQERRRTRHVEQRRQENRPVHKALEDARDALPDAVFHDEKTHTAVICGPQGRAHVFNAEGRHVTSFVLGPDAVAFRLRTERWRRATPDEAAALKKRIGSAGAIPPEASRDTGDATRRVGTPAR